MRDVVVLGFLILAPALLFAIGVMAGLVLGMMDGWTLYRYSFVGLGAITCIVPVVYSLIWPSGVSGNESEDSLRSILVDWPKWALSGFSLCGYPFGLARMRKSAGIS